jgi:hypothetical protein
MNTKDIIPMKQYSVRKYFYVDTIVKALSAEEANDLVNDMTLDSLESQYLGDLAYDEPDVAEI